MVVNLERPCWPVNLIPGTGICSVFVPLGYRIPRDTGANDGIFCYDFFIMAEQVSHQGLAPTVHAAPVDPRAHAMPKVHRSLSARLLVLTIGFVMLAEILIFMPSASRFRLNYLEERIDAAHLAGLALVAAPDAMVSPELEAELLRLVGAESVVLRRAGQHSLMLSSQRNIDIAANVDLRNSMPWTMVRYTMQGLFESRQRYIRVIGEAPDDPSVVVEVVLNERPLITALRQFSSQVLSVSIVISLFTAGLVFLALQWLLVRPMRRLTRSMVLFRVAPEDGTHDILPSGRRDELGVAEAELAEMQRELRMALTQKSRLAALGIAVSKVGHDLRNILATAQLVSDRLASSDDPAVRRATPRLIEAIDRAIGLCARTLTYGRAEEPPPKKKRFNLAPLIDEVGASLIRSPDLPVLWVNQVRPDFDICADREQIFRVLLNLGRNAIQAIESQAPDRQPVENRIHLSALRRPGSILIEISDTGPGLSNAAHAHLFEPFRGGARAGGTGLGLAIAKELLRAHGGDIMLTATGESGTTFCLELPDQESR